MAAACGLEDSTIKTLGRWSSAAFQLYIRASPSDLAQLPAYQWYLMSNTYEASTDRTVDRLFILGSDLFSRYLMCI